MNENQFQNLNYPMYECNQSVYDKKIHEASDVTRKPLTIKGLNRRIDPVNYL